MLPLPDNSLDIKIVYEDLYLLVLEKPAGVPTQPLSKEEKGTIANFIASRFPEILEVGDKPLEPGLVHRLDVKTSGLVLVAKTSKVFRKLRAMFKDKRVKKNYYAIVYGSVERDGFIALPLGHKKGSKKRMVVLPSLIGGEGRVRGKILEARTSYKIIKNLENFTLLDVEIKTGVMHQIRAHLAYLGHPVVGEGVYTKNIPEDLKIKTNRYFLHAYKISFIHPNTSKLLEITSNLPSEFRMFCS